jgi:two-component system nitrogen regulation sensor histidine kinase NtrY
MKLAHERRIQFIALAGGLPAVAISLWIIWFSPAATEMPYTLTLIIIAVWAGASQAAAGKVATPLRTVANLLEAMREGDYSIRGRSPTAGDCLSEVMEQVNAMGDTLRAQRFGALEASALLRKVMEEITVAIFAFDAGHRLRLVNRGGEALLARPAQALLGETAANLGLEDCLHAEMRTISLAFPGGAGRWGINRSTFREDGVPHQLLVLADLTRPLREEELQAWQSIVRVLGHELNNSLAPIKSIAGSLGSLLEHDSLPEDWRDDMRHGLNIIESRAASLQRFLSAYARLARLPRPSLRPLEIGALVRRAAALDWQRPITVEPGPPVYIEGDQDQLEQVVINLIKNAVEAVELTGGHVAVRWVSSASRLEVLVVDNGPGLANTANLFVPFFTTKPGGSGIGLVLCRQIAEAHGGTLELRTNPGSAGCTARFVLPVRAYDLAPAAPAQPV